MKPIAVEAKKSFSYGFVLTEAELRRFIDLLETQFEKLKLEESLVRSFSLKFKNGVIAETPDIDAVTSQENVGSGRIVRLGVKYYNQGKEDSPVAKIEFVDADRDEQAGYTSIRYTLRAGDRDWVFVTSSLLSERVEKVKRFAFNQLGAKSGGSRSVHRLFGPLFTLILLFVFMFSMLSSLSKASKRAAADPLSEKLQKQLEDGTLADPIVALIEIQRHQENRSKSLDLGDTFSSLILLGGVAAGVIFILVGTMLFIIRYYPVYNFVWGDYEQQFKQREEARKFWIVVIGIGILVSVIGGLIVNRLNFS